MTSSGRYNDYGFNFFAAAKAAANFSLGICIMSKQLEQEAKNASD
jgi:hypothetical protein